MFALRLAWRELLDRPGRTALTVGGVALATFVLAGLLGYANGARRAVDEAVAHAGPPVVVTARGCPYEAATLLLTGGEGLRYLPGAIVETLAADPAVASVSRALMQPVRMELRALQRPPSQLLVLGVDDAYLAERPWLELAEGRWFAPGEDAVVVGSEVARRRGLGVGRHVRLLEVDEDVEVVGVLERGGGQEDGTALMPLASLARLFGLGDRVTAVGVTLHESEADVDAFTARVHALPDTQVVRMEQARDAARRLVSRARAASLVVAASTVAVALLGLLNTLLVGVLERRRELTVLRLLGAPRQTLASVVVLESTLLATLGAVLGLGAAVLGARQVARLLAAWLPEGLGAPAVVLAPAELGLILAGVWLGAVVVAAWPAARLARTPVGTLLGQVER